MSSEGSQRGSPRPNRGVSPHSQGVVESFASGFQVNQPAGNHSTSGAPDLHDVTGFLQRQEDILKDTQCQMSDLTRDLGDGLQSVRQDYQQSFAQFTQLQKSQFDQLKQVTDRMQIQIPSVDSQVKGLQLSLNKLASKEE